MALVEDTSITLANPERGFFAYTETHYRSDNSGYVALDATSMATNRTTLGQTLVFRYFFMEKYRTADAIEPAYLALVAADLAAARTAGCKLIIRFAYNDTYTSAPWASDPTPARVYAHIAALLPVINNAADVVFAVQAGFIGLWGEWYYSTNFTTDPAVPGTLSSQNWTDRTKVVTDLLDGLDARIWLLVRYAGIKEHIFGNPSTDARANRVGFHNDAMGADDGEYGTYDTFTTMSTAAGKAYMQAQIAAPLPMGGESAADNPPYSAWTNASALLALYRYTFLNPIYHPAVLTSWGSNIDTVKRNLGYRLVATDVRALGSVAAGTSLTVAIDIHNYGYSAPINPRPITLVIDDKLGHRFDTVLSTDFRSLTPGSHTLTASVAVPGNFPVGTYQVALWLPDQSATLSSRPEYAARLANTSTWDSLRGYTQLTTVAVTRPGGSRHGFGGDIGSFVVVPGGGNAVFFAAGTVVTFWTAITGGTQHTDLLDASGTVPITTVTSSSGGGGTNIGAIPQFFGPNGVTSMWAQAGSAGRVLLLSTDAGTGVSTAGGDTITVSVAGNVAGLTIAQNDTTNNPRALDITNAGTGHSIRVTPTGNTPNSTSVGGAILLNNTGSTGAGIVVYSNQASPTGHLIAARADNATFNQACFQATSAGTGHTASFLKTGVSTAGAALSAGSTNKNFSCLNITGEEFNHGTIKVAHNRPSDDTDDTNAAAVSIDLKKNTKAATSAQGIFMTSSDAGTFSGLWFNIYDTINTRFLFRMGAPGEFRFGNLAALPSGHTNFVDLAAFGDRLNVVDRDGYTTELVRPYVQASDYGLISWNYPLDMAVGAAATPAAATMQLLKVFIPRRTTITNVHLVCANSPAGLTGVYAVVYGPTGTLLSGSQSADQSAAWNGATAGTGKTLALGTPAAVNAGHVYVGWWYTGGTTAPTLIRTTGTSTIQNAFLNSTVASAQSYRYATGASSLTTLASTSITTFNTGGIAYWCGLS